MQESAPEGAGDSLLCTQASDLLASAVQRIRRQRLRPLYKAQEEVQFARRSKSCRGEFSHGVTHSTSSALNSLGFLSYFVFPQSNSVTQRYISSFPATSLCLRFFGRRPSRAEETQRFGEILYARPTDGGTRVEVLHARLGINGIRQVYRTKCDQNFTPVAPTEYLGPWVSRQNAKAFSPFSKALLLWTGQDEFLARMRASMTAVNVQDMFMMAFECKML